MLANSWVAEQLAASQEELSSIELVIPFLSLLAFFLYLSLSFSVLAFFYFFRAQRATVFYGRNCVSVRGVLLTQSQPHNE
jgi:hypothetical protein